MSVNLTNLLTELLYVVLIGAIPIVSKYLIQQIEAKKNEILKNDKAEDFQNSIDGAMSLVEKVVDYVSQTYVDALKKEGKFDAAAQQNAYNKAVEALEKLMDDDMKHVLINVYGDLSTWMKVAIESYIKSRK